MDGTYPQHLIGAKIPELSIEIFQRDEIRKIELNKEYAGKWLILFFYPADFTFVCPTELTALNELYPQMQSLNTEVVSVSTDTAFVHKAWHDHSESIKKITYSMAADPTGELCQRLGTYIPAEGLSLRATFIANPEGEIVAYEMHANNIGRNPDEILRKLQAAQYVYAHGAEVCPVNWKPGAKTLTPGVDLIGKI